MCPKILSLHFTQHNEWWDFLSKRSLELWMTLADGQSDILLSPESWGGLGWTLATKVLTSTIGSAQSSVYSTVQYNFTRVGRTHEYCTNSNEPEDSQEFSKSQEMNETELRGSTQVKQFSNTVVLTNNWCLLLFFFCIALAKLY